ncbi:MAG: hypothetical protein ABIN96_07190 [Rubrivivax sp.]
MNASHRMVLGRRRFVVDAGCGALALCIAGRSGSAAAQANEDPPNRHNMLVVGEKTIYLSHLPMFDSLNEAKTGFRSPHRFQVILEATFAVNGKDAGELYRKDRQAHPATRIYTLEPELFVLTRLFSPTSKPPTASFKAKVFRGHLEQGGKPVPGLENVSVHISRVVHAREFDPRAQKPTTLEYTLFGKGDELFMTHAIFGPPDFDQMLAVKLTGRQLDPKDLVAPLRLVIPDRKNVAGQRVREKQRVKASLVKVAPEAASSVEVTAGAQYYFEEGELLVPPTFDLTAEERKK